MIEIEVMREVTVDIERRMRFRRKKHSATGARKGHRSHFPRPISAHEQVSEPALDSLSSRSSLPHHVAYPWPSFFPFRSRYNTTPFAVWDPFRTLSAPHAAQLQNFAPPAARPEMRVQRTWSNSRGVLDYLEVPIDKDSQYQNDVRTLPARFRS